MDIEAVNVVDEANLPLSPAAPSITKYTALVTAESESITQCSTNLTLLSLGYPEQQFYGEAPFQCGEGTEHVAQQADIDESKLPKFGTITIVANNRFIISLF